MKNPVRTILFSLFLAVATLPAFAQSPDAPVASWHAQTIADAVRNSVVFGALGIAMVLIGFKIFDRAITKIDLEKEISNGNIAAAILSSAVIIGISIIISAAIS